MNSLGNNFRVTLTGTARGEGVGCVIEGIPAGFVPDMEAIRRELSRRAPRRDGLSTPRAEDDGFELLSETANGARGGALTVWMPNRDVRRGDDINIPRPSHADLVIKEKFGPSADPYDHVTSGRMTAPLVFAGAVAKQLLAGHGVTVGAHILDIHGVYDRAFPDDVEEKLLKGLDPFFPLMDTSVRPAMERELTRARENSDSVGGSVECAALGVAAGLGEPFFGKLTSSLAYALFSIPAVRGVWFGDRDISGRYGSAANDPIGVREGRATPLTNRSGGLNGGMSNGRPIILGAAFRPVPTIGLPQKTVKLNTLEETEHIFTSRSDVCVLPRAVAAVEAAVAITLIDGLMEQDK